jgi:hypothetical protein
MEDIQGLPGGSIERVMEIKRDRIYRRGLRHAFYRCGRVYREIYLSKQAVDNCRRLDGAAGPAWGCGQLRYIRSL